MQPKTPNSPLTPPILLTTYKQISLPAPRQHNPKRYMGRESSDQTMARSSIVLLQERFRQLQRVKEMREEKEMLKLFSDSDLSTTINYNTHRYNPSNLFFQSELLRALPPKVATTSPATPPSSCHVTCLSLWPESTHVQDNTKKTHCLNNKSWLANKSAGPFYDVDAHDNECDVDTSLHL